MEQRCINRFTNKSNMKKSLNSSLRVLQLDLLKAWCIKSLCWLHREIELVLSKHQPVFGIISSGPVTVWLSPLWAGRFFNGMISMALKRESDICYSLNKGPLATPRSLRWMWPKAGEKAPEVSPSWNTGNQLQQHLGGLFISWGIVILFSYFYVLKYVI